jgi:NAD(P)H-hydrate epimerase
MATVGMGDVLAGVIAALIAQGLAPYDAARLGAYAHGLAGDQVAAELGPLGLVAGDVAEAMPKALRALLALRTNQAGTGPGAAAARPPRTRAASRRA